MKKFIPALASIGCFLFAALMIVILSGCDEIPESGTKLDVRKTIEIADELQTAQATPTDIDFSLERYNLIRRAYWVNGQREKAANIVCKVDKPLGYIVLLTESGAVVGRFVVDGKVSSLNSYLTPDSEYYEIDTTGSRLRDNKWLADVDGTYGSNDSGIFFFTPNGQYIEWSGDYLYSDIPFEVDTPIVKVGG